MAIMLFDWGGSSIKYGVWRNEMLVDTAAIKTPKTWPEMQSALSGLVHHFQQRYAIAGVSISAPGNVDNADGVIRGISAIPYIHNFNIKQQLETLFSLPVCMENDANAAGIAEAACGAGRGYADVLFAIVGSGIGGAIVREGRLQRGSHKYAGEFGIMTLDGEHTFSELGTAVAMARRYCRRRGLAADQLSGEEVFRLADEGDAVAQAEAAAFYRWMAVGLLNLQVCFDPDCIVIGGGISASDTLFQRIVERVKQLTAEKGLPGFTPRLRLCHFRNDANLRGAAVNFTLCHPRR